jgi:MFS family permease
MQGYKYNFDGNRETVHNWITNMDLTCISGFQLGLFGSLYFVGFVIGALTLLRLGDIIGRKPVVTMTSLGLLCLFVSLFFVNNLYVIYTLLFIAGVLGITRGSLFYLYMLEMLPQSKRESFHTFIMVSEAAGGIAAILLMYAFQSISIAFIVFFSVILFHFFLVIRCPESPKFLHSKHRYEEAHESLKYIASANGIEKYNLEFYQEGRLEESHEPSIGLKEKVFLQNLLVMALNWAVCSLCFYIISYYAGHFPGSLYIN